jgi:hypothetical protein
MDVEVQRLKNIPVAKLVHLQDVPNDADGPYRLVWAFDARPGNITKGILEVLRPRICVGPPIKDGSDHSNNPIQKFAATTDMTSSKIHMALTAADGWHDFFFDIRQFFQNTRIPPHARPIICTQPKGYEEEGPQGQPKEEMFWQLFMQVQGTRTAAAMANGQFDQLIIDMGGFVRGLCDTRTFSLEHDVVGKVRLCMISDDGYGAAEKEEGIKYTLDIIKKIYTLSTEGGPWTQIRGFECKHDKTKGSVELTAIKMIEAGVEELMPGDLVIRPKLPCSEWIKNLSIVKCPEGLGQQKWIDNATWFRRAVGWAIHIAMVFDEVKYYLSMLCSVASGPSDDATKALKQLISWFYHYRHVPIRYGGENVTNLHPPTAEAFLAAFNASTPNVPRCLFVVCDADLLVRSRYAVYAMLNGTCIYSQSRLQPSISIDITASESYAYSVAVVIAEVARGRIMDFGASDIVAEPTFICTDNDATERIASTAAAAKRALLTLRRQAYSRHATDMKRVRAARVPGKLNMANIGTKPTTRDEIRRAMCMLRNINMHELP